MLATEVPALHPSIDGYPETTVTLVPEGGRPVRLPVKVADTPQRRAHGLMQVRRLPATTGMLFVFEEPHRGGFYMLNTLVPLSIAFARADGTITAILEMAPCPDPPASGCPTYTPEGTYTYALEVRQGLFDELGITAGASLRIPPRTLGG